MIEHANWIKQKSAVNYLFFGFFFSSVLSLHLLHAHLLGAKPFVTIFFFTDAFMQSLLETFALVALGCVLCGRKGRMFVALLAFALLLAHLMDFFLVRLMDLTFWKALTLMLDETWENFLEMLLASHVSLPYWLMVSSIVLLCLFLGLLLHHYCFQLSTKRPVRANFYQILHLFLFTCIALLLWDYSIARHLKPSQYLAMDKSLPWKTTFFSPETPLLQLSLSLPSLATLPAQPVAKLKSKPNIYFLVAESLREDFITPEIAPHLYRFKKEHMSFPMALSNANATQLSWFCLFHARHPLEWQQTYRCKQQKGAPALTLLKEMGYRIRLYSSSRLEFYKMHQVLFGKENPLLSYSQNYCQDQSCQSDACLFQDVKRDLERKELQSGQVFVIFLEATHFDYSFPEKEPLPFEPVCQQIDYLKTAFSKTDLEKIKNRYRNALWYLDKNIGEFFLFLRRHHLWNESIISFSGDHGEEFCEAGALFHASHLSRAQTHIPLYIKLCDTLPQTGIQKSLVSQIDIFPTIFFHLGRWPDLAPYCHGSPIQIESPSFVISGRYNASRSPHEFFIHNGRYKLVLQKPFNAPSSPFYRIIGLKDIYDYDMPLTDELLRREFFALFEKQAAKIVAPFNKP